MTLADAQEIAEDSLVILLRQAGVTALDLAEQALLGRQQRPQAVDVDRPAFQDDAVGFLKPRLDPRPAELLGNPFGQACVVLEIVVLRPTVEPPLDELDRVVFISRIDHERRPRVPRPDPIGPRLHELDSPEIDPRALQAVLCLATMRGVVDDDHQVLVPRQLPGDFGVNPRDRPELARPIFPIVRPGDPRPPRAAPTRRACGIQERRRSAWTGFHSLGKLDHDPPYDDRDESRYRLVIIS